MVSLFLFFSHLSCPSLFFFFPPLTNNCLQQRAELSSRPHVPGFTRVFHSEEHVVILLFSLQTERWDVFAGTKHTCGAVSLHFNGVFHPSISQPPASNIYPRRRASPTNGPPLSATHRFSVARIKDLSDIILSHVSQRRRFSETRNLMFRLTSLDISLWISLPHACPPTLSFERRPCNTITAHRHHQACECAVLQVNRCCLFVYLVAKRIRSSNILRPRNI